MTDEAVHQSPPAGEAEGPTGAREGASGSHAPKTVKRSARVEGARAGGRRVPPAPGTGGGQGAARTEQTRAQRRPKARPTPPWSERRNPEPGPGDEARDEQGGPSRPRWRLGLQARPRSPEGPPGPARRPRASP